MLSCLTVMLVIFSSLVGGMILSKQFSVCIFYLERYEQKK
jgi:hypothetical protein